MFRAIKVKVLIECFSLSAQYQAESRVKIIYENIISRYIVLSFNKQCTGNDGSKSTDSNSLKETEPAPPLSPRAPRSHSWEFSKQRLQVREVFGQGAFGQVVKGLAFEIAGNVGWTMVAIKMLKGL